jgi:hypothetical protein
MTPLETPLYVAIPTHDSRTVVQTMIELASLSAHVGKISVLTAEGGNIPRTRNMCMEMLRRQDPIPPDPTWVLWVDSDILIPAGSAPMLAQYITEGITSNRPWLAHYRMADGRSVLMKERALYNAQHYSDEELIALPDWSPVGMGGFGLALLPMDLAYQFHADMAGEDIHFWLDHPDLIVHIVKGLRLQHRKAVWI